MHLPSSGQAARALLFSRVVAAASPPSFLTPTPTHLNPHFLVEPLRCPHSLAINHRLAEVLKVKKAIIKASRSRKDYFPQAVQEA